MVPRAPPVPKENLMASTIISGMQDTQLVMSGTDTLTITATGIFRGDLNPAVLVNATTSDGVTIDNAGTLASNAPDAQAIRFANANASFTLINQADATITSQN